MLLYTLQFIINCISNYIDMERLQLRAEVVKDREREIPPYTGFGSEEDSLTSSKGLEPRPPQADFFKFMHKDRLDHHIYS